MSVCVGGCICESVCGAGGLEWGKLPSPTSPHTPRHRGVPLPSLGLLIRGTESVRERKKLWERRGKRF